MRHRVGPYIQIIRHGHLSSFNGAGRSLARILPAQMRGHAGILLVIVLDFVMKKITCCLL